ncbi:hypothetical protein CYLTODRAFT_359861 [Cylindrobasidium torrendii FP15055 ss-10]|uniref:Prolyl 4-hydroxylase alpha subunit Fe(2+) 2OG dioxygenase domain-containing protein n=1 Tax=Cylindrobasidium torrendii FP15055 ss-10 TaxID=1314674 RepID=A0A0D7B034_9AGAR|nr:hypothetical protein CYLTODRAFT_359861 [Cylindrobasidium torrendii FP15055 ss-10]
MSNLEVEQHPAIHRIRAALEGKQPFTSGTCPLDVDSLNLYYRLSSTEKSVSLFACPCRQRVLTCSCTRKADVLNLANATPEELQNLISACDAAPFGRGNETVMDESYRKALKLELAQFSLPFELIETGIVNKIQHELVDSPDATQRSIRTELYKLNIYDKGSFFKAHKDTPRDVTMFGSLVIIFPTTHEGGNLVLSQKDEQWTFDAPTMLKTSTPEAPSIAWVAFYSNVTHEVLPVTSGARVTLTYNLYFKDAKDTAIQAARSTEADSKYAMVKKDLAELVAAHDEDHLFGFGLAHEYPLTQKDLRGGTLNGLAHFFKGSDALICAACEDLGLNVSITVLYEDEDEDDELVRYLSPSVLKTPGWEVHRREALYYKMTMLKDVKMTWVTPETENTKAESKFIAYGNEASLDSVYGKVCMVASKGKHELKPAREWA